MSRVNWEMDGVRKRRVSKAALSVVRMCCGADARIEYVQRTGQFSLRIDGLAQVISARTVEVLTAAGLLSRTHDSVPRYTATDRARQMFFNRSATEEGPNNDER